MMRVHGTQHSCLIFETDLDGGFEVKRKLNFRVCFDEFETSMFKLLIKGPPNSNLKREGGREGGRHIIIRKLSIFNIVKHFLRALPPKLGTLYLYGKRGNSF